MQHKIQIFVVTNIFKVNSFWYYYLFEYLVNVFSLKKIGLQYVYHIIEQLFKNKHDTN